jgi:uncharacterized protein
MRALLDVNVLIALLDVDHSSHKRASAWLMAHSDNGWASCPITQNGCIRIMAHPGYPGAFPVKVLAKRLREATQNSLHEFWPDEVSILDETTIDTSRIHGPRQITDVYLLALAVRHGARFVTFDRGISIAAATGADQQHLLTL